jgi:hypothetical protein
MEKIIFTILTIFLVFSCEKENDFFFSGITERNNNGIPGSVDETDWRFDDVWSEKEEKLFDPNNFEDTYYITGWPDINVPSSNCEFFPNPVEKYFHIRFLSSADTLEYVIVNNDYDIILSYKEVGIFTGVRIIDTSDRDKFKANTIYRIYYKLKYLDGKVERGHGDILIRNE